MAKNIIPTDKELSQFMLKYAYETEENAPEDAEWSNMADSYIVPFRDEMTTIEKQIAKFFLPH